MTRKVPMQQNVPSQRKIEVPQKTGDNLGNLRIDKTKVDGAPKATFKQVPYIWYPTTFLEKFVLTEKVRSMPYTLSLLKN